MLVSLLDTDLYKFTMMQAVLHHFPGAVVEYRFKCRDPERDLRPYADEIRQHVAELCELRFNEDELAYLGGLRFIKPDFVDFLRLFHLQERYIDIRSDGAELEIVIRGPWLHTILFEVPVLAIVSETFTRAAYPEPDFAEGDRRLDEKIRQIQAHPDVELFRFSDFGTRRRFSRRWQRHVIERLKETLPLHFSGTSNVWLAKELGLTPIGTMAPEFLQAAQALGPRLVDSQKYAFEIWAKEYRGDLGIALSDVVGVDAFLRDFDLYFCKLFDGMRHDSGDPFEWTEKVLAHYRHNRIDPRTKHLVYSDSLTMPRALAIYDRFKEQARLAFGIGTSLTNDLGHPPLNIVIKMTECNGQPVAKLSDSPGKAMCHDETYLAYLRQVFKVPEEA
jgi:nicotinate phosphoribosyltransferase